MECGGGFFFGGVGAKLFGGNSLGMQRPPIYAFLDIFGPDLTRHVVAFGKGIAICDRQKFGQVWGSTIPLPEVVGKLRFRKAPTSNNSKMVQDRAIFIMADQWKIACGLSNGAIFNDLKRPLTWFSRSRHFLTLNISQTATDMATVTIEGK